VATPWPHPQLSPKERDFLPQWHVWQAEQSLAGTLFLAEAEEAIHTIEGVRP